MVFTLLHQNITQFRANWKGAGDGPPLFIPYIPLVFLCGIGIVCLFLGISSLVDRNVKLTINESGIHDQRKSNFIPWHGVQSVDCIIGKGVAKLNVYRSDRGDVQTTEIDISGLEKDPQKIFSDIKTYRIQMDLQGEPQVPGSPPGTW